MTHTRPSSYRIAASSPALARRRSSLRRARPARSAAVDQGPLPVPMNLRNAPTGLMKKLGYGAGYQYPHEFEGHYVPEEYLPAALRGTALVKLSQSGLEKELSARFELLKKRRGR